MKKVAIITDTSGYSKPKVIEGLYINPIGVIVETVDQTHIYNDTIDIQRNEILNYLKEGANVTTSQPRIGEIIERTEQILEEYDAVVFIVISKKLSGSYYSLKLVQDEFGPKRVHIIDTMEVGPTIVWMIEDVRKLLNEGKTFKEIDEYINDFNKRCFSTVIVKNAKQLVKGGRLSGLKGMLVNALKIKLIIKVEKGKLEYFSKDNSMGGAASKSLELINEKIEFKKKKIKRIAISSDLTNKEEYDLCLNNIKEFCGDDIEISSIPLPGCIISHVGSDTFAITIESKE